VFELSARCAITRSISYSYTNGDLTSLVTPSGQTVTYGYTNGQVTSIAVNGSSLLSQVLYEPFGPVSGWTWSNNAIEARVYDQDGNITNLEAAEGFTYGYDSAFRVTGITDADNAALSQIHSYDLLDRLTGATGTNVNESWTYDANGNRLTQGGATASTYTVAPSSNQLASISGGLNRTYAYAPSGQATSYGGIVLSYRDSARLSSVTYNGATTSYIFNALGQRIRKSGASVALFVYDEAGHLLGEYDGSGNLIEETIWMGDVPVATLQPNGTGVSVYYIHTDHLNTPRRITSSSTNAIVWRWDSDPFGTTAANQNPSGNGTQFVYTPRFPGQYYDAETGLDYNYHRDYDPAVGRYVESDPIGVYGGINMTSGGCQAVGSRVVRCSARCRVRLSLGTLACTQDTWTFTAAMRLVFLGTTSGALPIPVARSLDLHRVVGMVRPPGIDTTARIEGGGMRQLAFMLLLSVLALGKASGAADCRGIDRALADDVKASLAPVVATQLHIDGVDILQSFKSDGWTILYVDPHTADEVFLFYSKDPSNGKFVTHWSGTSQPNEQKEVRDWVLRNAPGIPTSLANCFAWHVTHDRDM
jgi:RHS repeat-associated protein